jgi:hypothetical protein
VGRIGRPNLTATAPSRSGGRGPFLGGSYAPVVACFPSRGARRDADAWRSSEGGIVGWARTAAESLTVEHAGEPLSRYEVRVEPGSGELRSVARPRLFENSPGLNRPQRRLFALDALGEGGWLKVLRLEGYALRTPRRPPALQEALFPYAESL